MITRLSFTLLLIAGCSGSSMESDTDTDTGGGTSKGTAVSDSSASTTDPGTAGTRTGPSTTEGEAGSQSGSASETGQTQGTGVSGTGESTTSTSTTGDPSTSTTDADTTTTGDDTTTTGDDTTTTGECGMKMGPEPVELGGADDLGGAGAYILLAKTAITNVPGSLITGGHVAVSPTASTSMTGFALVLDPSGVFSTSPAVAAPWRVYAANYTVPTPSNLTTAVLAMEAAYTDAAGRVPTDFLDLANGNIGGLTLAPGLYTWGSNVLIPKDVTLDGCEDDVWIFQISENLNVATGKSVILSGGAQAKNVFWQIAGEATIHANAHFEGVILSKTGITLQTGATLHGRALAQTMVALDMNPVTAP